MKATYIVFPLALMTAAAAPARAADVPPVQKPICIDPHYDYQALYLKDHDIVIKQTLGRDHRQLKLTTTCIDLRSAMTIRVSADFRCLDKGDNVATNTIDGHFQQCRITHIEPYAPPAGARALGQRRQRGIGADERGGEPRRLRKIAREDLGQRKEVRDVVRRVAVAAPRDGFQRCSPRWGR